MMNKTEPVGARMTGENAVVSNVGMGYLADIDVPKTSASD